MTKITKNCIWICDEKNLPWFVVGCIFFSYNRQCEKAFYSVRHQWGMSRSNTPLDVTIRILLWRHLFPYFKIDWKLLCFEVTMLEILPSKTITSIVQRQPFFSWKTNWLSFHSKCVKFWVIIYCFSFYPRGFH